MSGYLRLMCLVALLGGFGSVSAAAAPASAHAATLKDLAWLAGHWSAEGEGRVEEIWSEPVAGTMTGMFRLVTDKELRVLEYVVISEEKGGIFYRFKHFNADYSTWEKGSLPLVFRLEDAQEGRVVFKNTREAENQPSYISYLLNKDGTLTILVGEAPDKADSGEMMTFVLKRR
jgi:hypothetical protein